MRWALAHGVAKVRGYSHLYVSEGDADKIAQLDQLAAGTGALDFFVSTTRPTMRTCLTLV